MVVGIGRVVLFPIFIAGKSAPLSPFPLMEVFP